MIALVVDRRPDRVEPDRDLRQDAGPHILGVHVISVLGFLLSGVLGVWLLWGVIRSGRLYAASRRPEPGG